MFYFVRLVVAKLRKFKKKTHFLINKKNVMNSEQVSWEKAGN